MANPSKTPTTSAASASKIPPQQPKAQQQQSSYQMSHGQGQVKNPDQDKRLKENRDQ
jgi:hypothetical protein